MVLCPLYNALTMCPLHSRQSKWRMLFRVILITLISWMAVVNYCVPLYRPSLMINDRLLNKLNQNEMSQKIVHNLERITSKKIMRHFEPRTVSINETNKEIVQHLELMPVSTNETNKEIVQHLELMLIDKIEHNSTKERFNGTACDLWKSGQPLNTAHVINPDLYYNVIVPKTDCNTDVYLVIYVHSSPNIRDRRDTIRRTWGNVSLYDVLVRLVFIVGETVDVDDGAEPSSKDALREEILNYDDIVQSNFTDTYRNLTHKAIAGLKWINQHCRSAKYVLKTDDDVFINIYLLLRLLRIKTNRLRYKENMLMCNVFNVSLSQTEVSRSGKWKATEEECSLKDFPTFCQGIAFVMTMNVAFTLYDASKYVPLLWMDDVYLTGFLPAVLPLKSVVHFNAEAFYMSSWTIDITTSRKVLSGADAFKFIFYHEDNMKLIDTAWSNLKRDVLTQEFRNYSYGLLCKDMQLERKRLKNITCTRDNLNNCYFAPSISGPAGPPGPGPWGSVGSLGPLGPPRPWRPVGLTGPWGPAGPPVDRNVLQSFVGFPRSPMSEKNMKSWELQRGPGPPSYRMRPPI